MIGVVISILFYLSADALEAPVSLSTPIWKDGIYLSHDAFLNNTPDIEIRRSEDVYTDPLRILRINPSDFGLKKKDNIRYVVQDGLPYVRTPRCCPAQTVYVGLSIVGSMSVLFYESEEMVDIPMKAYNPYNGKPYLSGTIQREKKIDVMMVVDMKDGALHSDNDPLLLNKLNLDQTVIDREVLLEHIADYNKSNPLQN